MILIIHQHNKPIRVVYKNTNLDFESKYLSNLVFELAVKYPAETIIWCHKKLENHLNIEELDHIFTHKLIMTSYSTSQTFVIADAIGYVEQSSPFINISYQVKYPTWRMSSDAGGVNTKVINALENSVKKDSDFEYFLNSLAKIAMPNGLLCYSNPQLLKKKHPVLNQKKASVNTLFKFVKQHYKSRWILLLSLNYWLYERKITLFSFLKTFFVKNYTKKVDFSNIELPTISNNTFDLDVVIPTIGRKKYLYDVLTDLNKQTILPKNVIIIEQNPEKNAVSSLDYLKDNDWEFAIKHQFIHQTGACNARNLALKQVSSNWVFFADDDIRMNADFIEKSFDTINKFATDAITVSCLLENEIEKYKFPFQWPTFGSGCSIVNMTKAQHINFDMAYEHGFGEDADFGMQLRNQGIDIIYVPSAKLLHLKAPMGGFRTTFTQQWKDEKIQPKPSPTVMLYNQKYNSTAQLLGYKTLLFIKFYRLQTIKNPFKYFKIIQKRWKVSKKWSQILSKQHAV